MFSPWTFTISLDICPIVIIDEVHLYRGMLGSNSAYLFRRLNSCVMLAGGVLPQYITASATINDPVQHSSDISGIDTFEIVGPNMDTSPSCPTKIFLIGLGNGLSNLLTELTENLVDDVFGLLRPGVVRSDDYPV